MGCLTKAAFINSCQTFLSSALVWGSRNPSWGLCGELRWWVGGSTDTWDHLRALTHCSTSPLWPVPVTAWGQSASLVSPLKSVKKGAQALPESPLCPFSCRVLGAWHRDARVVLMGAIHEATFRDTPRPTEA